MEQTGSTQYFQLEASKSRPTFSAVVPYIWMYR